MTTRPARKAAAPATPAKAAARTAAKTTVPRKAVVAAAEAPVKAPKKAKQALVRDSFTMPEADFALIATLKKTAMAAGREAKKSELLRAGLQALARLKPAALVTALNQLATVKQGRPRKGH